MFAFTPAGGGPVISGPVTVKGTMYPNIPRVSNFDAGQAIDATGAFTLAWEAFVGAGPDDFILVSIDGLSGTIIETPPPPLEGALPGTVTSLVIPAGAMQPGQQYQDLCFRREVQTRPILSELAPGPHSLKTSGVGDTIKVGLIEVYEVK